MVEIPVYERDKSGDYLYILKSLNEIPFPLGRNLLIDFLKGNKENPSIEKNNLNLLQNFSSLESLNENEISSLIETLIRKKFVDLSPAIFKKEIKVLAITKKGQEELMHPTLKEKKQKTYSEKENKFSNSELKVIKELNSFLGNLNLEQRKAVVSNKKKILVLAGAGSGKTTVLTKRIEFLNKLKKVKAEKILAITFTRKAKNEMEKRLKQFGVDATVETFNSFSEKVLLKNTIKIYGRKMRVAKYSDKMVSLLKALESIGIKIDEAIDIYFTPQQKNSKTSYELQALFLNDCFSVLNYYKNNGNSEKLLKETKTKKSALMMYQIAEFLSKYMRVMGLRTYEDQVEDTLSFFRKYPKKIPQFEHILVDEYQDVNSSQVELLKLLSPENIFYVGDPRQSIFGWRGSNINYILKLLEENDVEVINLKRNYRSNTHIINFMNSSIKEMGMPPLTSSIEGEKEIKLCRFENKKTEFEFVYRKVLSSRNEPNEIFVLSRTNKQLKELSSYLKERGIQHITKTEETKNMEPKKNQIILSTIHSIKGLEAQEVYIIGCSRKNFPPRTTEHPIMELIKMYDYDKDEEEKRLFYVAISRAKNKLYLTYSGKKHTYLINEDMKEFLDEVEY